MKIEDYLIKTVRTLPSIENLEMCTPPLLFDTLE